MTILHPPPLPPPPTATLGAAFVRRLVRLASIAAAVAVLAGSMTVAVAEFRSTVLLQAGPPPPTETERALENQIETARLDLLSQMRSRRQEHYERGEAVRAKRLEEDIAALTPANFFTHLDTAPTELAEHLVRGGRIADALVVIEAFALADDDRIVQRAKQMAASRPIGTLGLPDISVPSGADPNRVRIDNTRLDAKTGAFITWERPELLDFEIRGKLRVVNATGIRLLLRRHVQGNTPNAFIFLRFPVSGQLGGRGASASINAIEITRRGRGVVGTPLLKPISLPGTFDFVLRAEGSMVRLWIDREPVAALEALGDVPDPSGIGLFVEGDSNNNADVQFTDFTVTPLRAAPNALD